MKNFKRVPRGTLELLMIDARRSMNITQKELSERTGVTQAAKVKQNFPGKVNSFFPVRKKLFTAFADMLSIP